MNFTKKYPYCRPTAPTEDNRTLVGTAKEIGYSLRRQLEEKCKEYKKLEIFLSGEMDSSILHHTYLTLIHISMSLYYVDINWNSEIENLRPIMISKGGSVHSIESSISLQRKKVMVPMIMLLLQIDYRILNHMKN